MADLAPPVVLLVDDNDDVREMYAHMLRSAGFEVRGAADGDEALAAADDRPRGHHHGPGHARA